MRRSEGSAAIRQPRRGPRSPHRHSRQRRNSDPKAAIHLLAPHSIRIEQPNAGKFDFHRLYRELLPRLGFFPDFSLDRSQFLLLPLPALLGPSLATLDSAFFHRPPHVGVPRLGKGILGSGGLLERHAPCRRSRGVWRRSFPPRGCWFTLRGC